MYSLDKIDFQQLGERLRKARIRVGVSQEEAAKLIEVARTTMIAIEQGQRKLKPHELVLLADAYSTTCNELLHPDPVSVDVVSSFRMAHLNDGQNQIAANAASLLQRLSMYYVEVERLVSRPVRVRQFQEFQYVKELSLTEQAEDHAANIRAEAGLGLNPIQDMPRLLESWGYRVFERPLDNKISGVFAYADEIGPCVLLNSIHPDTRINFTAAHEFGHDRIDRKSSAITWNEENTNKSGNEKFAWAFGQSFLMPRAAIRKAHDEICTEANSTTVGELVYLAKQFHVSVEAMAKRLEVLGMVRKGTARLIAERGVESSKKSGTKSSEQHPLLPPRLAYLLSICEARGLLSESQMTSKFQIDRSDLRELLDSFCSNDEV